jgi:hypothetical protein
MVSCLIKHMDNFTFFLSNSGQNQNIGIATESFEKVAKFK